MTVPRPFVFAVCASMIFSLTAFPAFSQTDTSSLITLRGLENADVWTWNWSLSLDGSGRAGSADAERIYKQLNITPKCQSQPLADGVSERCMKDLALSTGETVSVLQLSKLQSSDNYVLYALMAGGPVKAKTPKVPFTIAVTNPADTALLMNVLGPTQALTALNDRFSLSCDKAQHCAYIVRSLNYYSVGKGLRPENNGGASHEEIFARGNNVSRAIQKGGFLIISGDEADRLATAMGLLYDPRVPYKSKTIKFDGGEPLNCARSKSSGDFCFLDFRKPYEADSQPFLFPESSFSFTDKKDLKTSDFAKQFYFQSKLGMLTIQCAETETHQTCAIKVNPLAASS